jgi:hypothetical protein
LKLDTCARIATRCASSPRGGTPSQPPHARELQRFPAWISSGGSNLSTTTCARIATKRICTVRLEFALNHHMRANCNPVSVRAASESELSTTTCARIATMQPHPVIFFRSLSTTTCARIATWSGLLHLSRLPLNHHMRANCNCISVTHCGDASSEACSANLPRNSGPESGPVYSTDLTTVVTELNNQREPQGKLMFTSGSRKPRHL